MLKRISAGVLAFAIFAPAFADMLPGGPVLPGGPGKDVALREASLSHNVERVAAALKDGADPNAPSNTGRRITPLGAVAMGSWRLTNRNADLARNENAVKLSQSGFSDTDIDKRLAVEIAKRLFAAGAKLGLYDKGILFQPIANGNEKLVSLLIDRGASVTGDLEGFSPPELAKKYNQEAVYDLLVARGGIPVDSRSATQLAFVEAASNANIEGMEKALRDGAKIDDFDPDKQTALIASVRWPTYDMDRAFAICWLLDHGADPNVKGESGFRDIEGLPLHIFIAMNTETLKGVKERPDVRVLAAETLSCLLKAGAKISGMDSMDRTPLHIAAKFDNVRAAEILIENGAKVMPRDNLGKTPLAYAESAAMIKLLKQNGATEQ